MKITDLRAEDTLNPIGLWTRRPSLSWRMMDTRRGACQTAYRVLVASEVALLNAGKADRWDSGIILSSQCVGVLYAGVALGGLERCHWTVLVTDELGIVTRAVDSAWFETALDASAWQAGWIGWTGGWVGKALAFRRVLQIAKPVITARLCIAGLGYYETSVNGIKIGSQVLDPAWTDYSKRVLYATHDIVSNLVPGENVLGVLVGSGWYGTPKLIAQLMLTYCDGTQEIITTGREPVFQQPRWVVGPSPITTNSIFSGETYDARLECKDWDAPEFKVSSQADRLLGWMSAVHVDPPGLNLEPQPLEPIKIVAELSAISMTQVPEGDWVFDFGQNIAGWCALKVSGMRGDTVTLRFAETTRLDGTIDQDNLRTAQACDTYILRGDGEEVWEPRFTYHGFRYVQVAGWPGKPTLASLTAKIIRSAAEPAGDFTCSDPLITQIYQNAKWTEAGNLHGLPTDCPQRDERMGWLNDLTVRADAAVQHFRLRNLYAKFLQDIVDTQDSTGAISDTAPFRWGSRPADPVAVSFAILPWLLFTHYGDRTTMARHYGSLKAWHSCLAGMLENGILNYSNYGDWAPPISEGKNDSPIPANTPGSLISTGSFIHLSRLMALIATALEKEEDTLQFEKHVWDGANAFENAFWDETQGVYGSGNQACQVFPLWLTGWLETNPIQNRLNQNDTHNIARFMSLSREQRVMQSLVADIKAHRDHITTGNICTRYLFEVLSRGGKADLAHCLITQRTYPSYGFMVDHGATTVWERWEDEGSSMNSRNHPMYGSIAAWMFRDIGGLCLDPEIPGAGLAKIQPRFTSQLDQASTSLETVRGRYSVNWVRSSDKIMMEIFVPANGSARVILENIGPIAKVTEGKEILWQNKLPRDKDMQEDGVLTNDRVKIVLQPGQYELEIVRFSTENDRRKIVAARSGEWE